MKEIGSEYWEIELDDIDNNLDFVKLGTDNKLLMSGRTAIDYVINDIENEEKIVYMPNYCCKSMVQPFIDNKYTIEYYHVDLLNNKYEIDLNFNCTIFFAMNYFGYNVSSMDDYIDNFKSRNIIVIEDVTHRFLCNKNHSKNSDYLICSLRKWFPIISGGLASKINGLFKNNIDNYTINDIFVEKKKNAMRLKKDYIQKNSFDNKDKYLQLFSEANHMLQDYKQRKIDDISINILKSINIEEIKRKRYENAKLIESKLKDNKHIKLIYKIKEGDAPLFIPIILKERNIIREKLIKNNIYCPIHWPNDIKSDNNIFDMELSLICDQRYNICDIEKYINNLIKILGD